MINLSWGTSCWLMCCAFAASAEPSVKCSQPMNPSSSTALSRGKFCLNMTSKPNENNMQVRDGDAGGRGDEGDELQVFVNPDSHQMPWQGLACPPLLGKCYDQEVRPIIAGSARSERIFCYLGPRLTEWALSQSLNLSWWSRLASITGSIWQSINQNE